MSMEPWCALEVRPRQYLCVRRGEDVDLNKFTQKAEEAIVGAQSLANEQSHGQIEPAHLLLALLRQADGIVPQIIQQLGGDPAGMVLALRGNLQRKAKVHGGAAHLEKRYRLVPRGIGRYAKSSRTAEP